MLTFVNKKYTKEVPFSQKWYIRVGPRGGGGGGGFPYKTLLSNPPPPSLSLSLSLSPSLSLSLSTHPHTLLISFVVSLQNWLAFESIHRPLFSEHNDVNFQNRNVPSKSNNFAFCKVCNKSLPVASRTNGDKFGKNKTKNPVQRPVVSSKQFVETRAIKSYILFGDNVLN